MANKIGTTILVIGILIATYGGIAFFIVNSLPPNGGENGRLPSLYLLLGGMAAMLVGTIVRGLNISQGQNAQ